MTEKGIELWDIYNIDRCKIGKTVPRLTPMKQGEYYAVVEICVFDYHNRVIIQRRQLNKRSCPGMWNFSCGGHVQSGETVRQAAGRELKEELGIDYDFEGIRPQFTEYNESKISDYYLIKLDISEKDIKIQKDELLDAKLATEDEVIRMIDDGEFRQYRKEFVHLLFAMQDGREFTL